MTYFNDNEPYAAQWLRNLYPEAHVDQRSVTEVSAEDIHGHEQAHFFAGIGGWQYALELAGWRAPAWTASLPCQPFSGAGKQRGTADERHLWPVFRNLVAECRPPVIFGEQVASPLGREWLAGVRADLEVLGYAVGAADLCAASVSAPHIRQRLYWVAYAERDAQEPGRLAVESGKGSGTQGSGAYDEPRRRSDTFWLGDTYHPGSQGRLFRRDGSYQCFARPPGMGPWGDFDAIECSDGKIRRFESSSFPLANGVPARASKLRAYGNAIVPQVAAQFVTAFMEASGAAARD